MIGSRWRSFVGVALALVLACLACGVAQARPTVSGILKAFNPGARRLQIQRDDGVVKSVVLSQNAAYEVYGNKVAPSTFKPGMRVAVRICGSLADDPLEADLLTDYGSSSRYVSRSAGSPYSTPVGNYATGAGSGGVSPGLPALGGPSVMGPMGMGGNFPGSLTNPAVPGPINNSAFPTIPQMTPGATTGAQPSPLGSPFTGQVVAGQVGGPTGTSASPSGQANPYAPQAPYGQANLYAPQAPYGQANPYGNPSRPSTMLGVDQDSASPSVASMIGGSNDDDDEDEQGGPGFSPKAGGPLGAQVVQFQARVMSTDPRNRVLTVVPAGSANPIQVSLPPTIYPVHSATGQAVPIDGIRPGQGVMVHGLSNAAGIVEARQVQVIQ